MHLSVLNGDLCNIRVLSRYTIPPLKNEFTFCKSRLRVRVELRAALRAVFSRSVLATCVYTELRDMPPKRGKVGGSSAKTPTQPRAKRTRRVNSQAALRLATDETPTATAAAALTGLKDSSHLHSEDVDPSLIVDYNESTPSPRSDDEERGGEATPTPSSPISPSFRNIPSPVLASAATTYESTARKGAVASPLGITTTPYDQTIIHNGSDIEDPEPKAPLSTRERAQSIPHARRIERGYVRRGIPLMPPPNQWPRANGPRASLLERAIVDAHDYHDAYHAMRAKGKSLGRMTPIPVVLRSNETPDQYEAEFARRIHPHSDVMKQRSQRINFARQRVREIMGGTVPPVSSHYATSASPFETSEVASAGAPFHRQLPSRAHQYAGYRSVPKSQSSSGNPSIERGSDTLASRSGGQATFQQGSVDSRLHPQVQVAPDRSGELAHLFAAALPASVQSQALSAAERRIADLESQVSRLTSELHEIRAKDRQGYERLKTRLDLHEKIMLRDPRYSRDVPRSPSPRRYRRDRRSEASLSPSPSPLRHHRSRRSEASRSPRSPSLSD